MTYGRLALAAALMAFSTAFVTTGSAGPQPELIPRDVIFGNPEKAAPRISPDAKMLSYLAPVDDVLNVWVRTIGMEDDRVLTKDADRGIRIYFWAADSKHIMYLQDIGGDENWRLYAVNIETGEIRELTPYEGVQVQIVDWDKNFPDELLISMNKEDPRVFDVYHLDIPSG
jgi:Tol biopolymer transport system component